MKKPSVRRQKLREKALAEYLTVPPEERAKRNREFVRKMRGETQAWDDFQKIHLDGVMAHYAHAKEKHPYFCDMLLPPSSEWTKEDAHWYLNEFRNSITAQMQTHRLLWSELCNCEIAEAEDALINGGTTHAVEECYDAIAVLLRTIDVLEGRQKLGKPEKKGGAE